MEGYGCAPEMIKVSQAGELGGWNGSGWGMRENREVVPGVGSLGNKLREYGLTSQDNGKSGLALLLME